MREENYLVSWIKYDRNLPQWRPIYKFQECTSLEKAEKLKSNIQKQTSVFTKIFISKILCDKK